MENMSCYYQNFRGLRTKLNHFKLSTEGENYDLILGTETWLNESIDSSEFINCNRYEIVRCDRNPHITNKERGGGVMIEVSKKFKILDWVKESDFDALYVKVKVKKIVIALFVVYFPPKSTADTYKEFFDFYEQTVDDNRNVYVTGDFNLPNLKSQLTSRIGLDDRHQTFLDFTDIHALEQMNEALNNNNRKLDLVLTATENCESLKVTKSEFPVIDEDANHPAIIIDIELDMSEHGGKNTDFEAETFYNFQRSDFLQLTYRIRDIDWTALFEIEYVNDAVDFLQ
ncbi:hypothetical protein JTB14_025503 [Gonioctena quinquepunctata]|nr:hypothetical protein JTB14_025503 [Gonioctena quinquepunctata]